MPYLAFYLLYAWQKWPAAPARVISTEGSESVAATGSWIPSLLYVYWVLHAAHLIIAAIALRSLWKNLAHSSPISSPLVSATYSLTSTLCSLFRPLLPWGLLALLFWIPGIYLEWPSDPWEHLRRINEWHSHNAVTAHSAWTKSSYFLSYSLTGHTTGLVQLSWLNVYYSFLCLLLCWQYYLLAWSVGLGRRASFIFVLLQALIMGNSSFSFYRYYGLSSSIFAQLGAVALTRVTLQFLGWRSQSACCNTLLDFSSRPTSWNHRGLGILLTSGFALLLLIAFNHLQGLCIAALGIFAVIVWRLIEWKHSTIGWLAFAAIALSVATVLWFPRHPALDEFYRPQGWLTAWYGFNLFSSSSPTFERCLHILGTLGTLNLAVGLWLVLRQNHVAGWLTLMPVGFLAVPCFAVPLAHELASHSGSVYDNIVAFHRLLFAVPMGLALVTVLARMSSARTPADHPRRNGRVWGTTESLFVVLPPAALLLAVTLSPNSSTYNRFWHSTQVTPNDLQLRHHVAKWTPPHLASAAHDDTLTVTSPLGMSVRETFSPRVHRDVFRQIHGPASTAALERQLRQIKLVSHLSQRVHFNDELYQDSLLAESSILTVPLQPAQGTRLAVNVTLGNTRWQTMGGDAFEASISDGTVVISNRSGASTHAFNSDLIPVDRKKRYELHSTVRQHGSVIATNYLAVAWYDRAGKLLYANQSAPEGAGMPTGWSNGTYSYYGLIDLPGRSTWTCYTIDFGLGESASIPMNAAFIRIGALLNYHATPEARIQFKDVVLQEKPGYTRALYALPSPRTLYSPYSPASLLSRHWSPQKVIQEHAGLTELRVAVTSRTN